MDFENVAFLGIGLINGSMAAAMRARGFEGRIAACARKPETRDRALELGLCDEAFADPAIAVRGADLVVIGVPPGSVGTIARAMVGGLDPKAIVTDVSSTKGDVIRAVVPHLPDPSRFVAGHPVAGTEQSGPDAAFATLFEGRRCILTPIEDTDRDAVVRIRALWESLGSLVDEMNPEHHDQVLAITSHVPHLIAYTIVATVADLEDQAQTEVFKYAAGGFTDFTRIAASD
ncbi:MAG: prephenate dehydrogenase/arogenate dehydrogenase family protein, partial [Pseudomonadota bacterium]